MRFAPKVVSPRASMCKHAGFGVAKDPKPCLSKVIAQLKGAVEKLQLADGMEASREAVAQHEQQRKSSQQLAFQVELLQGAFTTLADAVLEELDDLAGERCKLQQQQAGMASALAALEGRVEARMAALDRLEGRLDAREALGAGVQGVVDSLARSGRAQQQAVKDLRGDLQVLQGQVCGLQKDRAVAASEVATAALNATQRREVRELSAEAARQAAAPLVGAALQKHAPPMVQEAVEAQAAALRREVDTGMRVLGADVARLSSDAAALRAEAGAATSLAKRVDVGLAVLEPRVARMEAAAEGAPPAASVALVGALEDKVEALAGSQARYSRSMEGVVRALVDDTAALSGRAAASESALAGHSVALQDTKEALIRSAQVFSHLLKVPPPVSSAHWKPTAASIFYPAPPSSAPLPLGAGAYATYRAVGGASSPLAGARAYAAAGLGGGGGC